MNNAASGWCLSGELTREQSMALENSIELVADMRGTFPPTCSSFEQRGTPLWKVDIYFSEEPAKDLITAFLVQASLADWTYIISPIEDRDWVSESQKLLAPVRAGRFLVFGSHDADKADNECVNLQIDAGQAFGTGKHETTAACLQIIDNLAGTYAPNSILDLGTGTGVLALAANKIWPNAQVLATDIDPIAVDVTRENLTVNETAECKGEGESGIQLAVADGLKASVFKENGPFELIIANILAGPLIDMAGDITAALSKNGNLILSGLLIEQKEDVIQAYSDQGLTCINSVEIGEWAALHLQ